MISDEVSPVVIEMVVVHDERADAVEVQGRRRGLRTRARRAE